MGIAQGLTQEDWTILDICVKSVTWYQADADEPLIAKGLTVVDGNNGVTVTPLGYRVLEWRELFRDQGWDYD